jgi:tetratricopeptide (TPR) repeat protein
MFVDMVGYSSLAHRDEALALRLVGQTAAILRPLFERHRGREVKTMGDGFLVEFDSSLDATEGAVAIQHALYERNQQPGTPRLEMRIGIHLGDVVHQDTDVLGDAVNIASRIEPLAEASGICLSGPVYELVRNKVPYSATRLEHAFLKNIETPIAVYSLDLPWHAPPAARVTPWTDRVQELATLRQAIAEAAQSNASAIAIAGESGIGKTRFAEEAIRHAKLAGFRILRGRGFEEAQRAPYALWAEAARSFLREAPSQLLYKVSENCATELLTLLPELKGRLGPTPPAPAVDPESARLRFFGGITQFFQNLAKESPVLLLLDDLQWADSGSLALLNYLGPRVGNDHLLVLLTYRDVEVEEAGALREVLANLQRNRFLREVALKRFDSETTRELVGAILTSSDPPRDLVSPMTERTGGNPYFVEELLRSLVEEGILVRSEEGWKLKPGAKVEIPSTVRDVVRRRVGRVGKQAADVLSAASVLGGEFSFDLLRRVTGMRDEKLLHLVEALLRARLLHERELSPGISVLRFGDEQIRKVLYEGLSRVRRQRYHAKAGEELEGMLGANAPERAGELAHHFLEAGRSGKALDYLEPAAERAIEVHAREEAVDYYRMALEILELQPDPRRRFEVLRRLGEQEDILDHTDLAVRAWREAAEGFEKIGDRKAAADLFGSVASLYRYYYGQPELALGTLERGRRLVAAEPESPEAARFYLTTADFHVWGGQISDARRMAEKALQIAERFEARKTEVGAHVLLADLTPVSNREELFQHLDRALELVQQHGVQDEECWVYARLGNAALLEKGDAAEAVRWFSKGAEAARKTGNVSAEMSIGRNLVAFAQVRLGELAAARALMEELFEHTSQRHPRPLPHLICTLGEVSLLLGDEERASEVLKLWLSYRTESVPPVCRQRTNNVLARWYLGQRDYPRAVVALRQARDLYRSNGLPAWRAALGAETLALLVEACLSSGDEDGAKAALADLRVLATDLNEPVGFGYLQRSAGLWDAMHGDVEASARAFEQSIEAWTKIGWRYELAKTLFNLGSIYSGARNSDRAVPPLERALVLFSRMGARPDAARTLGLITSLKK